jgi:hypothetical protein
VRQNPRRRIRFPRPATIAVCVLVVAAGAVIAWWITRPPPALPLPHASSPALPQASCGRVITNQSGVLTTVGTNADALTCFAAAARGCKAASIAVTEMSVDTGTRFLFTIDPGGTPCRVTEAYQWYSANFGGSSGPITSMPCRLTAVTGKGVMLICGGQDVLIPTPASAP